MENRTLDLFSAIVSSIECAVLDIRSILTLLKGKLIENVELLSQIIENYHRQGSKVEVQSEEQHCYYRESLTKKTELYSSYLVSNGF